MRALERLREAEVVVYDRLVNPAILDEAPPEALRIFAGKRVGSHCLPQAAINALLIHHAEAGRLVVRLKGGDPFVFGRGGEEALALSKAGIPFEVVPGVSSAIAVRLCRHPRHPPRSGRVLRGADRPRGSVEGRRRRQLATLATAVNLRHC